MGTPLPEGQPLKEFAFEELVSHARAGDIAGWIYPKGDVSRAIGLFSQPRQAALNLWGWIAILTLLAGIIVPAATGNWLWALLVVLAFGLWKANRKSMEQFFLEQLVEDRAYFESIGHADIVRVVLKEGVASKRQSTRLPEQGETLGDSQARPACDPRNARELKQKLAEFDARLERNLMRARERQKASSR